MSDVENRAVATTLVDVLGERPKIVGLMDEEGEHTVAVAAFADRLEPGLTTYSTLSLHDVPNVLNGHDIRVEIVGTCQSHVDWFAGMLGSVGFFMMKNGMVAAPGEVFPDIVRSYYDPSTHLPHVYLTSPMHLDELSRVAVTPELTVHWLQAVPISDAELAYLQEHGDEALEALFEAKDVEYVNLNRPSVI